MNVLKSKMYSLGCCLALTSWSRDTEVITVSNEFGLEGEIIKNDEEILYNPSEEVRDLLDFEGREESCQFILFDYGYEALAQVVTGFIESIFTINAGKLTYTSTLLNKRISFILWALRVLKVRMSYTLSSDYEFIEVSLLEVVNSILNKYPAVISTYR